MKTRSTKRVLLALIALVLISLPGMILAATPPCTSITNQATVNYSVGGVSQPAVNSNTASFTVGVKVRLVVTNNDGANVSVSPGTTKAALKFTVLNDGNATNDVALSYVAAANGTASPYGGGNDSFDGTTIAIYEDTNSNGTFDDGTDQLSSTINDLAQGSSKVYFIVYTPDDLTQSAGSIAVYYLVAQAQWANGSDISEGSINVTDAMAGGTACGAGGTTVDVVFADDNGPAPDANDGTRDGKHSDDGAYIVQNAAITVSKTSAVYSDPVNGTSSPKAIPGAVVTYTITISNTGNADATVSVTDSLATQITNGYLAFKTQFDDGTNSCSAGQGIVVDGTCKTNANDGDNADWNVTTANTVTVTNLTVPAGQNKVVKFQVVIQ
jgi:uncharacterized repeat protein (TIGR01451 family)